MGTNTLIFLLLLPIVFTFWAIVDLAQRDLGSMRKKLIWGFFVVFFPPLGGPIYLIFGRGGKKVTQQNRRQETEDSEE
jgi:hypothetical protein